MIKARLGTALSLVFFCLLVCGQAEKSMTSGAVQLQKRGATVEQEATAATPLDSVAVQRFVEEQGVSEKRAAQLLRFYRNRNFQPAWFDEGGLVQQARTFWALHNRFVTLNKDSSFFNAQLHRLMNALLEPEAGEAPEYNPAAIDVQLTDHFFDYAQYAYAGKIDPADLQWHIPRKSIDAVVLLDSLMNANGGQLDRWEPVSREYRLARTELLRLHKIQKSGGWPRIDAGRKVLRRGDSLQAVVQVKSRLAIAGDYGSEERSPFFSRMLETAVRQAQKRFGLQADGVIGPATLRQLNQPLERRIEQLLVNMERMRWMPPAEEGLRLVANIPEYKLHVYNGKEEVFQMRIVVGKAANKTVVFNDQLKNIVFSPYWNVPASIVRKEILPQMKNDPGYLARNNMEQTGQRGGLPVVRQKPGAGNALGRVKFLFPNSFNIYFHDTPAKSLFEQPRRAFSHGCIRLAEPTKLAAFLLKGKGEWTEERIVEAMHSGRERWVTLEKPVPVMITYFTAWVDKDGLLNLRPDIYGHDRQLAADLFSR